MLKFFNLHGHDGHSIYDAIGSPEDHAEWVLKNAGESSGGLAITNHGNMNSAGAIAAAQKKYKKNNTPIKFVYGAEFYYIHSLEEWNIVKEKKDQESKDSKKKKKDTEDDEEDLVIEDEKESKQKLKDAINRRNHLVLLAQNQEGLKNLFRLVSRSYRIGFYKKPRIDFNMLKECSSGLIASTACLGGIPSYAILHTEFEEEKLCLLQKELYPLMDLFGKDRFYLELQFNMIPEQKIVNKEIIRLSKETGYNLIATCDAHFPEPSKWKDREIYKLLGYQMKKENIDLSILDMKQEDLQANLYLKNGDQLYKSYKEMSLDNEYDNIVKEAIERTYDIGHNFIENVSPDSKIKLPKTFEITQQINTPFDKLKELCLVGLKAKKITDKKYIERAAYELKIIKSLGVEEYFLALQKMLEVAKKYMLLGPGRGCFVPSTKVKMANYKMKNIEEINIGEKLFDHNGDQQIVTNVLKYDIKEKILELEFENNVKVRCTKDHMFFTVNRGFVMAKDLTDEDEIKEV